MKNCFAYISVGSNVGNKLRNCQEGIAALTVSGKSVIKGHSHFYESEPVDYKNQAWFVNAVVKIETAYDPYGLLRELQTIERNAGRTHETVRYGPRTLDLDIVLYGALAINSSKLILPHPRMHKRRFVLRPICDIDPFIMHPVLKKDMRSLLSRLVENGQRIIKYR